MAPVSRVLVLGEDGTRVAERVVELRAEGARAAGFVGEDEAAARAMGEEMLGGVDEVVRL